ncbi:MAG: hypothetical protein COC05_03295 [Gammaproteobacteria bacterium]|nr:MAG: hypothetical protein COC05_03295 [Gammaproteobacteria bacterium]
MSKSIAVKIYGERNTGTNYLSKLIDINCDVKMLNGVVPDGLGKIIKNREWARDFYFSVTAHSNFGWKHAVPMSERIGVHDNVLVVTLTKNPYSWLLSLFRRAYHMGMRQEGFGSFLRAPCRVVGRENYRGDIGNPVALWNIKNGSYLKVQDYAKCSNVKYESLLQDPQKVVEEIVTTYRLPRRNEEFKNLNEASKTVDSGKDYDYYRRYYLEEQWKDKLQQDDVDFINQNLDDNIIAQYGYEKITNLR